MAHFEIHVLNFNGQRHLERCLNSLQKIDSGGHYVHVNVVDNGSSDNSKEFVKSNFPTVSFIELGENLGFSGGNNQGSIRAAERARAELGRSPDYDVFLNNDTEVTKDWLINAAKVLESEPEVGIVGSKALFMDRFISLRIKVTPPFKPSNSGSSDSRILGCFVKTPLEGENLKNDPLRTRWKNAWGPEPGGRWLSDESTILIPIADNNCDSQLNLSLRTLAEHADEIKFEFFLNNSAIPLMLRNCRGGDELNIEFKFSKRDYVSVIQNSGCFVTPTWESGDLGFGDIDNSKDTSASEVSAICGVSMFIRHSLFQKLGGFDARYFAYFEDTDLSVRARLAGFKCKIVPSSVLYHLHCGSSGGEWSPTFSKLVAFSHLLFTSKFAPKEVWQERLTELKRASKEQFEVYLQTKDLDHTPQFRTYLSYLKKPHVFQINRFKRAHYSSALENYPFSFKDKVLGSAE